MTAGSRSFLCRSHIWRLDAASRTQKTVGRVRVHCTDTTGSPAVESFHSSTGCSWEAVCSLMLPSPQPTYSSSTGTAKHMREIEINPVLNGDKS